MHKLVALAIGSLIAITALALSVGSATANRLSISNRSIRVVFNPVSFVPTFGEPIECDTTIEGTFHSNTIAKTRELLLGWLTRAVVNQASCVGGTAFALNGTEVLAGTTTRNTLPWHIRYRGFTGTLPRFERVILAFVGVSFLISVAGIVNCLYRSTVEAPVLALVSVEVAATILRLDETALIPLFSGGPFCPTQGALRGSGPLTLLGTSTPITLRLI